MGPNGAGKTTMLNIVSGQEDADEGRVLFAKGARVGYLEQEAIEMDERPIFEEVMSSQVEVLEAERRLHELEAQLGENPTEAQLAAAGRARDAYEALGGYTIEAKVRSVMFGLGFKEDDLRAPPASSPAAGRCASRSRSCSSATPRCCCSTSRRTTWTWRA